jgi:hypothetical protein
LRQHSKFGSTLRLFAWLVGQFGLSVGQLILIIRWLQLSMGLCSLRHGFEVASGNWKLLQNGGCCFDLVGPDDHCGCLVVVELVDLVV